MKGHLLLERLPVLVTACVASILFIAAGLHFPGFLSFRVALNLISDNAFLGALAIGETFVILAGGIDLSVGSMVGFTSILLAVLIENHHVHPAIAIALTLLAGLLFGAIQGRLIAASRLEPFLVTLGGLFFLRGAALWISQESIQIDHPLFNAAVGFYVPMPGRSSLPTTSIIFLVALAATIYIARQTRFGRAVYAIGGNLQSAELLGLPVRRTVAWTYALCGFMAALGGVIFTIYTGSGNAISGVGSELDAIAAVVIGGTLLTGGYGSVFGTFLGVLTLGIVQSAITFQGTLSSWWTRIVIGVLLLGFLVLQKLLERAAARALRA